VGDTGRSPRRGPAWLSQPAPSTASALSATNTTSAIQATVPSKNIVVAAGTAAELETNANASTEELLSLSPVTKQPCEPSTSI